MKKPIDYSLYLIADVQFLPPFNPVEKILQAVAGGVTIVQLRAKKLPDRDFYQLAQKIKEVLSPLAIPFIVDDRIDIALAVDADGVHLGQKDLPVKVARHLLGSQKIIGLTANRREEALSGEKEGADYLGIGPVFPTSTKENPAPVIGPDRFKALISQLVLPVVAIGGINPERALELKTSGAAGIAVSSFILQNPDPEKAACLLMKAWKN
ncbi:thiamine-phosphate diphosphorylase [Thermosyntropha lipolytica DSM 11003]|uniref:Thiamine-phosphate synthase n=1 Tax=Thermosyntropha lipolytica DSM 11003 TaxID=1123382 RepID=A0A1M5JB10_9FIRM|nr:thiamine phosphate synthase [Thermosyntropha lipolytica]SHG37752.1 thiamine-phosphate diphosphorylase [Thermosyntropha lipolytica DSM 11003]